MAHPDQWGAHDQAHDVSRLGPYTKNPLSGAAYDQRNIDTGALVYADRFKPRARIKDPFFLITFVSQRSPVVLTWLRRLVISIWHQFAGFCVVSALALSTWISQGGLGGGLGDSTGTSVTLNRHTVYLLLFIAAAGLSLSTIFFIITRAFTSSIIHITLILTILLNVGACTYYYITKYCWGDHTHGHLPLVDSVLCRIPVPYSTSISTAANRHGHRKASQVRLCCSPDNVVTRGFSKRVVLVYRDRYICLQNRCCKRSADLIHSYAKWTLGNPACNGSTSCSSGTVTGLVSFETFSYVWTSLVVGNVSLTTLAGGPFGCWYYFGTREAGLMPKHPTLSSFWRASTLSLGSVALGSLIVTILEIIRLLLSVARSSASAEGSPMEACLACCAGCIIGCIEGMVQYFNKYAFIEIALYGKPYVRAAKDTWNLFKDRGIDTLVNDSLVGITLTWGAYAIGVLCSLFGFLYLQYTHPSYNDQGQYTAPVMLFSFIIGAQLQLTLAAAIEAGVSTIFVGLGEDPGILAVRAPDLFGMIANRYPRVVQGVPRV